MAFLTILTNTASIASIALELVAIEKHFIIDRSQKGPDSSFSIQSNELKDLVNLTNECWETLGTEDERRPSVEKDNIIFRRSLYFVKDLKKGNPIKESDVRRIRPGFGLKPKHYDEVIGKEVTQDVERGDPLRWDIIK